MGTGDLNSGPHVCMVNTLPTEPLSLPIFNFIVTNISVTNEWHLWYHFLPCTYVHRWCAASPCLYLLPHSEMLHLTEHFTVYNSRTFWPMVSVFIFFSAFMYEMKQNCATWCISLTLYNVLLHSFACGEQAFLFLSLEWMCYVICVLYNIYCIWYSIFLHAIMCSWPPGILTWACKCLL